MKLFYANYMGMSESLNDAKDCTPRAEWQDIKCYVEETERIRISNAYKEEIGHLRDAIYALIQCNDAKAETFIEKANRLKDKREFYYDQK